MKNIFALAVIASGLAGCSQDPTGNTMSTTVGAIATGGIANALGANDNITAIAAILGGIGGQAINRANTGGCISTGSGNPVFPGGHVFFNPQMGFIQCPAGSIRNNQVVEELYRSPEWQPVVFQQQTRGRRGRGPQMVGFR